MWIKKKNFMKKDVYELRCNITVFLFYRFFKLQLYEKISCAVSTKASVLCSFSFPCSIRYRVSAVWVWFPGRKSSKCNFMKDKHVHTLISSIYKTIQNITNPKHTSNNWTRDVKKKNLFFFLSSALERTNILQTLNIQVSHT